MGDFFSLEGPFMRFFDKVFNLLWLNILVIICCLPVFTAGAAFTAMHYVLLRMLHNEEGYISSNFFKSFKENFKQATIIWLPFMLIFAALGLDTFLLYKGIVTMPGIYKIGVYVLLTSVSLGLMFVFPVLSHYHNTVKGTIKTGFAMAAYSPLKTILMFVICAAPWVGSVMVDHIWPLCLLYGFSLPGFLCATLYDGIFKKFEKEEQKAKERAEQPAENE